MACLGCQKRKKWIACQLLKIDDFITKQINWNIVANTFLLSVVVFSFYLLIQEEGFVGFLIALAEAICIILLGVSILFFSVIILYNLLIALYHVYYLTLRWANGVCNK
jgi:hypothetical protein